MATLLINYAMLISNYYGLLFSNITWIEFARNHIAIQKELGNFDSFLQFIVLEEIGLHFLVNFYTFIFFGLYF